AKLRIFQRALKSRVERRDALLDIVRGVNATLEPSKIADFVVDRVSTWVPAPSWALVSSDLSGQLTVLAERALSPDVHRTVHAIPKWVMEGGREFGSADLRRDARVRDATVGAVLAFPLSCRNRRIGAIIGMDPAGAAREPRLPASMARTVRVLLE